MWKDAIDSVQEQFLASFNFDLNLIHFTFSSTLFWSTSIYFKWERLSSKISLHVSQEHDLSSSSPIFVALRRLGFRFTCSCPGWFPMAGLGIMNITDEWLNYYSRGYVTHSRKTWLSVTGMSSRLPNFQCILTANVGFWVWKSVFPKLAWWCFCFWLVSNLSPQFILYLHHLGIPILLPHVALP